MTRALIADDEPALARALQGQLAQLWPELDVVHVARHGLEAAERIAALEPDLAFLDIRMPGLTGLEVAQGIEGTTRVVFVTAFDTYAVQAFEHAALDYLLKPVRTDRLAATVQRLQAACGAGAMPPGPDGDEGRLAETLQRLLARGGTAPAGLPVEPLRWVRASQGELTHQVPVAEVMFFQSDEKYTVVRTTSAEYLIRTPLHELLPQLDPAQFWQVHR
ncbi:MAG: LytR/AlgR family response regulator transcription factor, partial [Aquabacterium sp.]